MFFLKSLLLLFAGDIIRNNQLRSVKYYYNYHKFTLKEKYEAEIQYRNKTLSLKRVGINHL